MRTYEVTITGTQALLMHADDIEWADKMDAWKNDPANKKSSKAGDDRSPAFRWLGGMYHDGKVVVMPGDNIMRCIMEGGALQPTGKGQKTFKSQTQSGILPGEPYWPLFVGEAVIPVAPFFDGKEKRSFEEYQTLAQEHGFTLFVKRAKVGQSKHIRVRPRFDRWMTRGTLIVTDDEITTPILTSILALSGRYKGLGDWRPGGKTPGPWGTFTAEVREQK